MTETNANENYKVTVKDVLETTYLIYDGPSAFQAMENVDLARRVIMDAHGRGQIVLYAKDGRVIFVHRVTEEGMDRGRRIASRNFPLRVHRVRVANSEFAVG